MKKKSCLMLAVMLAMLQIIAVFAVVPASADESKTYNVERAIETITVDGKADETAWESATSSSEFVYGSANGTAPTAPNVSFKAVWSPDYNDASKINLYVLINVTGATNQSSINAFRVDIGTDFWTGTVRFNAGAKSNSYMQNWSTYKQMYYDCATTYDQNGNAVFEFCKQVDATASIQLGLEVMCATGWSDYAFYTWTGGARSNSSYGTATIVGLSDAGIPSKNIISATAGASIRLDTSEEDPKSGIRFGTKVDLDQLPEGAKLIKTGTLIIPTAKLKMYSGTHEFSLKDSDVTEETFKRLNYKEGVDYYDIENVGNQWVKVNEVEQTGTWYGTLYNIQSANFDREISGIGYAVVEVNGVEYTVYADYSSENHSRSIKGAAQALIDAETYAENTPEYALLQGFTQAEATQS